MNIFGNIKQRLIDFGSKVKEAIKSIAVQQGKVATGKTVNSLRQIVKQVGVRSVELQIWGSKVFEYWEKGRKKGEKMPPKGVLLEWMKTKGIPFEKEFLVRRAISEKGIKPVKVLKMSFAKLEKDFKNSFSSELAIKLSEELNDLVKKGFVFPTIKL